MKRTWGAEPITDQSGRVAVVTGGNRGLGLIVARELARAGAEVILACRSEEKGGDAARDIAMAVPGARVLALELDLASLASVRMFADRFASRWSGLDLLVNNAAVAAVPYQLTEDGFELQLGTNHLGHFALTGRLLDALRHRPSGRVVSAGSAIHNLGRIDFDDLQSERRYSPWRAYGQSKLATLLFAFELDRRLRAAEEPIRSVAAHPGAAKTHPEAAPGSSLLNRRLHAITNSFARAPEIGAQPYLFASTAPDLPGGSYVGPGRGGGAKGTPALVSPNKKARDEEIARRLWTVSENLTGVTYDLSAGRAG